ncbi:BHLH domain-containing protein [Aphelenchoides besseyi]|nr:BHLH domain-containing protein [Aphelenchoides besseyi]KAI6194350.1 BHLH domain-containing protein [Aphelenchoides besseyi]
MTRLRGMSTQSSPTNPMVWPKDRKEKKPLMEKHRRNRMNNSINNLKGAILRHFPTESSKLEKADILERTVDLVTLLEQKVARLEGRCNTENRCLQEIGTIFNRPQAAARPIGTAPLFPFLYPITRPVVPTIPFLHSTPLVHSTPFAHLAPFLQPTQQSQPPKPESHVSDNEEEVDVENVEATEVTKESPAPSTTHDSGIDSSSSPTNNLVWRPF